MKAGCRVAFLISGALLASSWTIPAQASELKLLPPNPSKKVATVRAAAKKTPRPSIIRIASIEAPIIAHSIPLILGVGY
jgi:hypothetical protein